MLGDRSLFAVERVSDRARMLDESAARYADASPSTSDILRSVETMVAQLQDERDRIQREATTSGIFSLGMQSADSFAALLEQIENFVANVVVRMERKIRGEQEPQAHSDAVRLFNACQRILAAVRGVSPSNDLADNAAQTVREATQDLGMAAGLTSAVIILGAVVVGAVLLLRK